MSSPVHHSRLQHAGNKQTVSFLLWAGLGCCGGGGKSRRDCGDRLVLIPFPPAVRNEG